MNEVQQNLQQHDNFYDAIAPVTHNTERQDESEGNTDTHPDLNESYDQSEELGIPSTLARNEPLFSMKCRMMNIED